MQSNANRATFSASTLLGDQVRNVAGEHLGTIKDIMLDLEEGKIAYAVLSFGGLLGLGGKLFAVPWQALQFDAPNHAFIFNVDKERLKAAEGFDRDHWPDFADRQWGGRVHDFYDVPAYWE